jgi:hypothetical protein
MQEKIFDRNYSRKEGRAQTLAHVSAAQAKRFLTELANLRDDSPARGRFKSRFADLLPEPSQLVPLIEELHRLFEPEGDESHVRVVHGGAVPPINPVAYEALEKLTGKPHSFSYIVKPTDIENIDWWLGWVGVLLPMIWDTPDLRVRESMILRLLRTMPDSLLWLIQPTRYIPGPFEQVLVHFLKAADRARHCNNPDCVAPYFFAKRRSQKYCSDACALPSQREFKRQWWAEHGEARRKARKASAKKSQRKRGK